MWNIARRRGLTLVTGNKRDFWNEAKFSLARSPGVVALGGSSSEAARLSSLNHVLRKSWLLDDVAAHATAPCFTRTRAVPDGSVIRTEFWDSDSDVVVEA